MYLLTNCSKCLLNFLQKSVFECCRDIAKHLSLPPVKLHCSMLAEDAIKAAIKDYEMKKAKLTTSNGDTPAGQAAEAV